jgi:threonine/homoserine/homoserine lactone efflux protein
MLVEQGGPPLRRGGHSRRPDHAARILSINNVEPPKEADVIDFPSGGQGELSAAIWLSLPLQFWLGYLAILLVPGPNSFLIATVSAARGFRGVLPLVLAISLGAASLALTIGFLMNSVMQIAQIKMWLPQVSALMLLVVAYRIITLQSPSCDPAHHQRSRQSVTDFALGYSCGLTNPVTALYFSSQLAEVAPLSSTGAIAAMAVGVVACSLSFKSMLAWVLALPWARVAVQKRLPGIKLCVAVVFGVMALRGLV